MKRRATINNTKGFTLMEILMAMFIFTLVLSMLYISYTGTVRNMEEVESQSALYGMARIAIERMMDDLASAYVSPWPQNAASQEDYIPATGFIGEDSKINGKNADTLRFQARAHMVFSAEGEDNGATEITYYVTENKEEESFTLYRSDTPLFEETQEEGAGGWILCDGVYAINFTYYDEKGEVYDDWDSTKETFKGRLPVMVSIELWFINRSDPESYLRFKTSVALPMARGKDLHV
jgi:general secretion pathway protein J